MMARPFDRERKEPSPINWRRGLFRLWVLVSSAWIMGWLIFFAIEYIGGNWTARDFLAVPVVLFGPPAAILITGIATRWAFRGFES
jgi:predicted membrane-bound dolichyl-phosphate-mannose-protein mannosyltransferase